MNDTTIDEKNSAPVEENSDQKEENTDVAKEQKENDGDKDKAKEKAEYVKIRTQFDKVLHKHILRLIEIDTEAGLKFDTATVAFLVLLVEREKELKNTQKSNLKRYNQDSFFSDLSDIGLVVDDELIESFQGIVKIGYAGVDKSENYSARIAALALVKFIDNLFSGMPGMNLIAYIIQCIDEVSTGRKELKEQLKNFEKTLVSRGVSISKQNIKEEEKETIKKTATTYKISEESIKAANELKKQRLASLRTKAIKSVPSQKEYVQPTRVKELFKKGEEDPDEEAKREAELAALELEKKQEEIRKREEELRLAEEAAADIERKKQEIAEREEEIKKAEMVAREAEIAAKEAELRAAELAAKEAEMAAREAEIAAKAAEIEKLQEEKEQEEIEEAVEEESLSVEDQIAQFEQELAMPCPVCSIGKISASVTDKNKEYFACTNESCKFISWAKPYHFECPLCKNPYLVEHPAADGLPGLKCPRAACTFNQAGIQNPATVPPAPAGGVKPKKKKKIVRRKKR